MDEFSTRYTSKSGIYTKYWDITISLIKPSMQMWAFCNMKCNLRLKLLRLQNLQCTLTSLFWLLLNLHCTLKKNYGLDSQKTVLTKCIGNRYGNSLFVR